MRQSCELCLKIFEILVIVHRSDVIGLRKRSRHRSDGYFVVESQVVEQSLFVAQAMVELKMIMHYSFWLLVLTEECLW